MRIVYLGDNLHRTTKPILLKKKKEKKENNISKFCLLKYFPRMPSIKLVSGHSIVITGQIFGDKYIIRLFTSSG